MTRSTRIPRVSLSATVKSDPFDGLPDDLVLFILSSLCSSASRPADFFNALLTCKRFRRLGLHPAVLSRAGTKVLSLKAKNWSESAHRFLKECVSAGSIEACYFLGMIRFYCIQSRGSGASLMAKAALKSHAPAAYSLAIIQFNGSGGSSRVHRDLRAGVALCERAASLGNVSALRELGHCFLDGYGVERDKARGHRLLVKANALEYISLLRSPAKDQTHPVNRFLREWFESARGKLPEGLRTCSNELCGRPETRRSEFRRCSDCGTRIYCSRECQTVDWKMGHKGSCVPPRMAEDGGAAAEIEERDEDVANASV